MVEQPNQTDSSQPVSQPSIAPVTSSVPMEEDYPVRLEIDYPERSSRWLAFFFAFRGLLLIPHIIVIFFLAIAASPVMLIDILIVLFTGRQNRSLFDFLSGYMRWTARINAYQFALTDKYPPFHLK